MNDNGKIALVTGAGSGIGRACALGLLGAGWTVGLLGRRADALQATAALAGEAQARAFTLPCNVADDTQVAAAFAALKARCGRLDLLFNNAGVGAPAVPMDELSVAQWKRSEERRVGKECVQPCRSRWSPYH